MLTELKDDGETIVLQDKAGYIGYKGNTYLKVFVYLTNHRIIVEGMKLGGFFKEDKIEKMFEINLENVSIVNITPTTAFNFLDDRSI